MNQATAEELAARRARQPKPRRRNTVSMTVDVGDVDVTIDLADLDTEELIKELRARRENGKEDQSFAEAGIEQIDAEAIFQLFRLGRREEAAERCELWLAEALGKVI